jgi:N-acetylglucosaminyl-diphospho-decaprenol L-rhamnosyltransferase
MNIIFSIVSHGQQNLVKRLVNSIDKFVTMKDTSFKIIVTENLEKEIDVYSTRFEIKKIINLRSKGFGANHNNVFEHSDCDYFFIVNPDIEFIQSVELDLLVMHIVEHDLDLASPIIINKSGDVENYKRSDLTPWNLLKKNLLGKNDKGFDWFAGIFLVIKSESFHKLSGFDTKFFMYVEDCDLSMRARGLDMKFGDISSLSVMHNARRNSFKRFQHLMWHVSSLLKYWFK